MGPWRIQAVNLGSIFLSAFYSFDAGCFVQTEIIFFFYNVLHFRFNLKLG